ncbi:N-acylhomoserine lactone synthase YspI [Yersinia frederiksenii]|uniref:Acyl-homoserine-lactone synthase n=1 Tax=Yersinia alsatica TaxID=2890317 RepID=A0ABY5URJ6_9GAMM|nr:acyl-homoserine-lactone synthase [Yersinia alsatica]OWF68863.1 acyl-homoserine-lactone synthase [Yersinia frederiksenii]OWF78667.1 acyl-homoserine-lactone synthase [Yersinia frederiksenii]UWM44762.1 acyl-homoserine-lactone synthase [Yersinia alsatica]CNC89388.1 N-acylhomoserine lactone synthase YspI [Yersinia frederiksenii]CNH19591.1 N-acylhomoserine lactone synthase YspI [Yersinia frederiksenii]
MLEIFDVRYSELTDVRSEDLYKLRKKTFKDRLNWAVNCSNDMEFDEYDNPDTRYLLGVYQGQLICSVRFIPLRLPNMITHTFNALFSDVVLPTEGYIESSRFFVDKTRAQLLLGSRYPISYVFFLSIINYSRHHGYLGIYTIVSRAMFTILRRSGWQVEVIEEGDVAEKERIYLLRLPTDQNNQARLLRQVSQLLQDPDLTLSTWPMVLPIISEPV